MRGWIRALSLLCAALLAVALFGAPSLADEGEVYALPVDGPAQPVDGDVQCLPVDVLPEGADDPGDTNLTPLEVAGDLGDAGLTPQEGTGDPSDASPTLLEYSPGEALLQQTPPGSDGDSDGGASDPGCDLGEITLVEPDVVAPDGWPLDDMWEQIACPTDDGLSNDDAVTGYINQLMYAKPRAVKLRAAARSGVGSRFEDDSPERRLYDYLKPLLQEVARGDRSDTAFYIPLSAIYDDVSFTAADLGLDALTYNGNVTVEAVFGFWAKVNVNVHKVLDALMVDMPYEMYWYDKTYGTYYQNAPYVLDGDALRIRDWATDTLYYKFSVAREYSATNALGTFATDAQTCKSIQTAATNARQIIDTCAGLSDLQKLYAFKDAICDRVSYNNDTANMDYGNPWQLVWVFDGDPTTNVVCEGYSKAFQYLCDMSDFTGDVSVVTATGMLYNERGGGGRHMWNNVVFDGVTYLADITNCDAGSSGYPEYLFMKGYSYCEASAWGTSYYFNCGSKTLRYIYDDDTADLYSAEELAVIDDPVGPNTGADYHSGTFGPGNALTWRLNASGALHIGGSGAVPDYTENNPAPWCATDALRQSVRKVYLGKGITELGNRAFFNCENLTQVILSDGIQSFGTDVFAGCHMYAEGSAGLIIRNCANKVERDYAEEMLLSQVALYSLSHLDIVTDYAKEPTCTEPGLTQGYHCSRCGEQLELQVKIPAKGHTVWVDEAVVPTCTREGWTEGSHCLVCGEVFVAQKFVAKLAHTAVTDRAVAATCTASGKTEGSHCSVCGTILKAQETVPAKGHSAVTDAGHAATCTDAGLTDGSHCSVCGVVLKAQETIPAKGHSAVTDAGHPATCTEAGLTDGSHCSVCGVVLKAQEAIPAKGHSAVTDAGRAATCTKAGLTEGSHCSVCGTVIKAQQTVKATGHRAVTDKAVSATCTKAGLTEGSHCSVCGTVIKAQQTVKATGHKTVTDKAVAATCTTNGKTEGSHCSVCGTVIKVQQTVKATGHRAVTDKAVAATCTTNGKTEGSHCSVCGTVIKAQQTIPAKGHSPVTDVGHAATCTENGLTEGSHCTVCGAMLVARQIIPANGHSIVADPGYPASCTADGLTDGSHCAVCNATLVGQQVIPATGHSPVGDPGYPATCTANGLTDGSHCAVCNATLVGQQVIPATGHTPVGDPGYPATAIAEGRTDGSHCAVCGAILVAQQPIPALGYPQLALGKLKSNGTVTLSKDEIRQIVPAFAAANGLAVTGYTSSKGTVASIDGNGILTCNAEGKAKITVTTNNKRKKATITIKVVDPYKPTAIAIAQGKNALLLMGQQLQLGVGLAPETARTTLTWSTNKPKVATVDQNGLVTPQGEGSAKITVRTHNKKKATITVKVVDPNKPLGIGIAQGKAITMRPGETFQLNAGLSPATAQSVLTWKTSKAKVATVDGNGLVTAHAKGKAKITVMTYNKKKATIIVNVVP